MPGSDTEGVSGALLDAWDEAYARWIDAVGDDGGGIAWDVLTDDAFTSAFTVHDWEALIRIGNNAIQSHPDMPPETEATIENDPDFATALVGLLTLMSDRFSREHPESIDDLQEQLAQSQAELARLEGLLGDNARMVEETAAIKAETARINAETAQLEAKGERLQRGRGAFSGWTTRLWRRKQIAPDVRLNVSKSGPSLTLGPKGGHVTYGPKGTTETIGVPGTGAYLQRRKPKE